jgi:hypothetical protein
MREFLLELYLEYGERGLPYRCKNGEYTRFFVLARGEEFIELIKRPKYDEQNLPYKLTAKALEYIKTHD